MHPQCGHSCSGELSSPLAEVGVCFPQHTGAHLSPTPAMAVMQRLFSAAHRRWHWVLTECAGTSQRSLETERRNGGVKASRGGDSTGFLPRCLGDPGEKRGFVVLMERCGSPKWGNISMLQDIQVNGFEFWFKCIFYLKVEKSPFYSVKEKRG